MAKRQFKAESKRLLDLMINSIYTHKEIFLRELISNASDAIDKLYYRSLTEDNTGMNRDDFVIDLEVDKEARTLKITDNGAGMDKDELANNLGTIAKSGSMAFKEENEAKEDIDIIGQFGVGFYSSFMVSDKVTVVSRAYGSEQAYKWVSEGADGYMITECEKEGCGTEITLEIKKDTDDEKYSQYLEPYTIKDLVTRYSDYIRYPIQMMMEKTRQKEDSGDEEGKEPEYETYSELETLNSMVPIWKKQKNELKDEDYNEFYKNKFHDYADPAKVIHSNVEGVSSYTALLFIPSQPAYDYYTKEYEKGLQLYSSGVMIMDRCPDLLPDHFSFVRGLVDSQDLSLNISREMLQHDRQLKAIAMRLEKKIRSELLDMQEHDREAYEKFFANFGLQLKYGLYDKFGMNKDELKDLVMFYSSTMKKPVTFKEYTERMPEEQKYIYYAAGESTDKIDMLPQTEGIKDKGYEILYLTADVDEFALQMLHDYDGREFKSVSAEDIDISETEEEKETVKKQEEESKDLLGFMKDALEGKVAEVRLSQRLKTHPVCLTAKGGLSIEMEKVLSQMPDNQEVKAQRVLEINAKHDIMKALEDAYKNDRDRAAEYTKLLYDQALLIEGMPVEDPVAFSNSICGLMTK